MPLLQPGKVGQDPLAEGRLPNRLTAAGLTEKLVSQLLSESDRARLQSFIDNGGAHNLVD